MDKWRHSVLSMVEVDLSRVAKLQKIAFWTVYWKTSNIATVVGGAAEENQRAYIQHTEESKSFPSQQRLDTAWVPL